MLVAFFRRSLSRPLAPRFLSHKTLSSSSRQNAIQLCRRLASNLTKTTAKETNAPVYPERLCIYHAGVTRITFLACVKLSTIFIFVFFTFVVTPKYYEKEGWSPTTIRTALSGVVPLLFVAWTTSPFVMFMHVRLPPFARQSEQMLRQYLKKLPRDAELAVTTMSPIAKARASKLRVSELRQDNQRLGIVNYVRDTTAEDATRKWYNYRAVGKFSFQANKAPRVPWAWDELAKTIPQKQKA
ncbi:hypothetical protein JX266_000522 [Neoarthrinium moseri]|nr:hypothetical protein JX266_000522 [Neoarthrinium moseri]